MDLQYPELDQKHALAESVGSTQAIITAIEEAKSAHIELYNSGAMRHLSPYREDFTTYRALEPPLYLNAANKQQFLAVGTGSMVIHAPLGAASSEITLENVLYTPAVGYTLISLSALDSLGYHMSIDAGHLEITSPASSVIVRILRTACGLYRISHEEGSYAVEVISIMELHCRMGHIMPASARKLIEDGLVIGIALDPELHKEHCNACIYVHATRQPVPKVCVSEQASHFGDEIHTDVWGPAPISTCQGRHFFITFMDYATHYTITFLLVHKGDTLNVYRSFEAWVCTQNLCTAIKVLCSDRGSEYLSTTFDKHLAGAGTTHWLTVHDTP
jgi:hypothetical protein